MSRIVTKRYDLKTDRFVIETVDRWRHKEKRVFLTLESFLEELGDEIQGAGFL